MKFNMVVSDIHIQKQQRQIFKRQLFVKFWKKRKKKEKLLVIKQVGAKLNKI